MKSIKSNLDTPTSKPTHDMQYSNSKCFEILGTPRSSQYSYSITEKSYPYCNQLREQRQHEYIQDNAYKLSYIKSTIWPTINKDTFNNNAGVPKIQDMIEIPKYEQTSTKPEYEEEVYIKISILSHLYDILQLMEASSSDIVNLKSYFNSGDNLNDSVICALKEFYTLYDYFILYQQSTKLKNLDVNVDSYISEKQEKLERTLIAINNMLSEDSSNVKNNTWGINWVKKELNFYLDLKIKEAESINNSGNNLQTDEYNKIKEDINNFLYDKSHKIANNSKQIIVDLIEKLSILNTKSENSDEDIKNKVNNLMKYLEIDESEYLSNKGEYILDTNTAVCTTNDIDLMGTDEMEVNENNSNTLDCSFCIIL